MEQGIGVTAHPRTGVSGSFGLLSDDGGKSVVWYLQGCSWGALACIQLLIVSVTYMDWLAATQRDFNSSQHSSTFPFEVLLYNLCMACHLKRRIHTHSSPLQKVLVGRD